MAIYIHWPYCESKCPYCDFNSYARRSISQEQFVKAALCELGYFAAQTQGRPITSIFFGGGTPSLMQPSSLSALLDEIGRLWEVQAGAEITLEANPSSVEAAHFAGYRSAGVNRVSVGVQSFNDGELRFLGRLHTAAEARQALDIAARHFDRVSFDLIYALPGQSEAEWRTELEEALGYARDHLSLYQLTIEPETAFFDLHRAGKLRIPEAELAANLYEITQEMCDKAGLPGYEISNHARPGAECRHNLTYWRYHDYLGVGPGAHGRLTVGAKKYATAARKAPASWHAKILAERHGCEEMVALSRREQAEEMIVMGLRLREGLDLERLQLETGYHPAPQLIRALQADGLLDCEGALLRVSNPGRLLLNTIIETVALNLEEKPPSILGLGDRCAEG